MDEKPKATGLKWRPRAGGREIPVWCARPDAVKAGFEIRTFNLVGLSGDEIVSMCNRLQGEMLAFLGGHVREGYDGTIASVIDLYQTHEKSPYRTLKPSTLHPYDSYLRRLRAEIGETYVTQVSGLDVIGWHEGWRAPIKPGSSERLGAAAMAMSVLKSALNWAVLCGHEECQKLRDILGNPSLGLPAPQSRTIAPTAAEIERARAAAHKLGHPGAALAYAIQFETAARQWDVIGEWIPLSDKAPSAVLDHGKKWVGPTWNANVSNMVLSITPTKTNRTTIARTHVDLNLCSMVVEELARQPQQDRSGPLIINKKTGVPYRWREYAELWAKVRKQAGLPVEMWNRDIRAGAITEGGMAGASSDDRRKMNGHADEKMTQEVYDRDRLEGSNRVLIARAKFRNKNT